MGSAARQVINMHVPVVVPVQETPRHMWPGDEERHRRSHMQELQGYTTTDRGTNRETERKTHRLTDKDRQIGKELDRQTNR